MAETVEYCEETGENITIPDNYKSDIINIMECIEDVIRVKYYTPTMDVGKDCIYDSGKILRNTAGQVINPNGAGKVVRITEQLDILNIDKNIEPPKSLKDVNIKIIGLGGLGLNVLHYWGQLLDEINPFGHITFYDNDDLMPDNIPRIQQELCRFRSKTKAYIAAHTPGFENWDNVEIKEQYFTEDDVEDGDIIISFGANISTREFLTNLGIEKKITFISCTHTNNEVMVVQNPLQNSKIQVEAYGKITLELFYLNMLKLSVELFDIINNLKSTDETDVQLFHFDMEEYVRENNLYEKFPVVRKV